MTLIASPIPPDRRYRPVQEADIHALCTHSESCQRPTRQYGNAQNPGQTAPRSRSDHPWGPALFGRGQLLARRASRSVTVSADDRSPGNAEIGSPSTTSDNVLSPIAVASAPSVRVWAVGDGRGRAARRSCEDQRAGRSGVSTRSGGAWTSSLECFEFGRDRVCGDDPGIELSCYLPWLKVSVVALRYILTFSWAPDAWREVGQHIPWRLAEQDRTRTAGWSTESTAF